MTSQEGLLFNWRNSESHIGFKVIAIIMVAMIFAILFGMVDVNLKPPVTPSFESATVLQFADDDLGRAWRLRAEESGPFPGRLEIDRTGRLTDIDQAIMSSGVSGWSDYEVSMHEFQADVGVPAGLLAEKGKRYFPSRVIVPDEALDPSVPMADATRRAVLTPFERQSLEWMPDEVPEFEIPVNGADLISATWRFLLRLRPDGSVSDCVSLSGSDEPGLEETTKWLTGLRFKPSDGERWLGLRVEFLNN